jgi:hypothetical protein
MRNVSNKGCRKNLNTRFMFSTFISETGAVYEKMEKCGGARGATDDMLHALCMLHK